MNKFFKKAIASALAASVLLTTTAITGVNAVYDTVDPYPNDITVNNILSDFQYFIKGDANIETHTVGSVFIGGEGRLPAFGDGALVPSYVNDLAAYGNYNSSSYYSSNYNGTDYSDLKCSTFYYTSLSEVTTPSWSGITVKNAEDGGYINTQNAFEALENQSLNMASSPNTTVIDANNSTVLNNVLQIDVKELDSKNITVSLSMLDGLKGINLVNSDLSGGSEALEYLYSGFNLNFVGVDDKNVFLETAWGEVSNVPENKDITLTFNGQYLGNDAQAYSNSNGGGGELFLGGAKFVVNFPDATGIVYSHHAIQHMVAPKATVNVTSAGAFEGCVIAAAMSGGTSESHFYPYYKPDDPRETYTPTEPEEAIIRLIKTYTGDFGAVTSTMLNATTFTLYETYSGTVLSNVAGTAHPVILGSEYIVSFDITAPISGDKTYYLKETTAPDDFNRCTDVIECKVNADGNVTYRLYNTGDFSGTVPHCENSYEDPDNSSDGSDDSSTTTTTEVSSTTSTTDVSSSTTTKPEDSTEPEGTTKPEDTTKPEGTTKPEDTTKPVEPTQEHKIDKDKDKVEDEDVPPEVETSDDSEVYKITGTDEEQIIEFDTDNEGKEVSVYTQETDESTPEYQTTVTITDNKIPLAPFDGNYLLVVNPPEKSETSSDKGNPDTGVALPIAAGITAALTLGAMIAFGKKRK